MCQTFDVTGSKLYLETKQGAIDRASGSASSTATVKSARLGPDAV